MNIKKSPLQTHFENVLALKGLVDRWSLNNHYIIAEHIKNINRAFQNELDYPATMHYHHEHLKELHQAGKHEEYELFYELYKDKKYLKDRAPLSEQERLSFVQRVTARCEALDCGWAYNTIINELNEYLTFLLSLSPDITETEVYAGFKRKMNTCLLGYSFEIIKEKLPEHEFAQFFAKLTQVPLFDSQDFFYLCEELESEDG